MVFHGMIRLRNLAMNDLQSGLTPFNTVKQMRGSIIVWIILKLWFWSFQWFFILQKRSKCLFATFSRHGPTHNIPVFPKFYPTFGRLWWASIQVLIPKKFEFQNLSKIGEFSQKTSKINPLGIKFKYWIFGFFWKKKMYFDHCCQT